MVNLEEARLEFDRAFTKPTCSNCKWSSQPVDRTVLWCSKRKNVAPTWYTCDQHEWKDAEETNEKE